MSQMDKFPQTRRRVKAIWGSTAPISSRPDRSCLTGTKPKEYKLLFPKAHLIAVS